MPGPRLPRKIAFEVMLAKSGLTAAALSEISGVPVRTIHEARTREFTRAPEARTVHGLARGLGVTASALLRAIGVPPKARRAFIRDSRKPSRKTA